MQPGQWIGNSGAAGTGAHLHYEMRNASGQWVEPYNFWASGDPIPMGYRDQNHAAHGPFALDYSVIRQKWFDRTCR